MARIAGVTTKKDEQGEITHVTINVKKHKQAVPILKELGLLEKSDFEKECEAGISIEAFQDSMNEYIAKTWKTKYG